MFKGSSSGEYYVRSQVSNFTFFFILSDFSKHEAGLEQTSLGSVDSNSCKAIPAMRLNIIPRSITFTIKNGVPVYIDYL